MDVERERVSDRELQRESLRQWLEDQQKRLESLRTSLDEQVFGSDQEGTTGELSTVDQHPADTADLLETRERTVAVETMLTERRRQIEMVLDKLRKGSYGLCERCGTEINPERLHARPDALYCIDCQRIMEKQRPPA